MTNYQKICQELIKDLPPRQKEVILRRFALSAEASSEGGPKRETLELIGRDFGITRERVRQIEEDGLEKIKKNLSASTGALSESQSNSSVQKIFKDFNQYLNAFGGFKKEAILLESLGGKKYQPQIYFLLTINENFKRVGETEDLYPLWLIDKNSLDLAKKVIDSLSNKLKEIGKPVGLKELTSFHNLKKQFLSYYTEPRSAKRDGTRWEKRFISSTLEISKKIQKNPEGLFGLKDWPEINPRGVKDMAYLVLKKQGEPLHFAQVANSIEGANLQTVHNELIRDPRFVLVGRGIYALKDWGYYPGQVKDIILKILEEEGPLDKEEILDKVLKQRQVKENTILLNLSNKKHFLRDSQGKYSVKEA